MDPKSADRLFWLRFLLLMGILIGAMSLITLPIVVRGWNGAALGLLATYLNAFTVLPACALAFWHRRSACLWLTINAVFLVIAEASGQRVRALDLGEIVTVTVPIFLAGALNYMAIRRWPRALNR